MESIKALLQISLDHLKDSQTEHSSPLDGLLSQWLHVWREDRSHALLIYILGDDSNQYEHRKLDFNNLEAVDKFKANFLVQQCAQQGACLHLAKMTSVVDSDPDQALELKMAISLNEIHDLNGGLLVNKPITIGKESIIQKSLLMDRYHRTVASQNPYPSPSEGSPILQTDTSRGFQDWVLVIMPEGHRFKFLAENADPQALHEWIEAEVADLHLSGVDLTKMNKTKLWGLELACKTQLNNISRLIASDKKRRCPRAWYWQTLDPILCVSLRLRDPDLFGHAVTLHPSRLSLSKWEEIGSTMELADFMSYRISLDQALTQIDSLQDRYIILLSIRKGCETQGEEQNNVTKVDSWLQNQLEQAMSDVNRVEGNDGAILAIVAKKFAQTIDFHKMISFAKRHSSNHQFAIEFAFSLYDDLAQNTSDARQTKHLLTEILLAAIPVLCLRGPHNWSLKPWCPSGAANVSAEHLQIQHADRMARLLRCCLAVGLYNEERALLRHFWLDAHKADAATLHHVFLPYLKHLLNMMHDFGIPSLTRSYQWQFQQVISLFIIRYIGKEPTTPTPPPDFTCPPLGCAGPTRPYGCPTCLELDAFLVDPHRQIADIAGDIDAPEHVAAQIQGKDSLQMTVLSHSAEIMTSTIRITKTKPETETEEPDTRHDLWRERVIKANNSIQAICGDEHWKLLLGDRYDECMGLKAVMI